MDPVKYWTVHVPEDNRHAIGIDVNNPVDVKYGDLYKNKGYPRPVLSQEQFGRRSKRYPYFLGFASVQIDSLTELLRALGGHFQIPIEPPFAYSGSWYEPVDALEVRKVGSRWLATSKLRGAFGHLNYFHSAKHNGKWDPLGLPWDRLV